MKQISSTPVEDALLRLWVWLSVHRKTRILLAVAATCVIAELITTTSALADDETKPDTSIDTYGLPLTEVTDTHGVPLDKYTELPLDYGQSIYITRQIRGILMRLAWMAYTLVVYSILSLCNFVLSLEWVDWILSPFTLLANTVQGLLNETGIVGLGIAIAALVIAWGFLRGKMGAAIAEIALVALFTGLVATPMANPSEHIKSWITTSADYGTEAGGAVVTGTEAGAEASTDPISGQIIDLTVRNPALVLSFGSDLEGDKCAQTWDDKAKGGADAEKLRKAVLSCNKDLKAANETDGFLIFAFLAMFWVSTGGLMALVVVFLLFLLKDVVLAGFGLVNTVLRAHLAVFPGGGRQAFLNAFLQLVVNVVMVGAYIFLLSLYLWLVGKLHNAVGGTVMMIGNLIFGLVLIALAITFWVFKRQGKSVGEKIARALGSSPLNRAPALKPSGFSRSATQLASTGRRAGTQYLKHRATRTAMTKGLGTLATVGAGAATGGAAVAAAQAASAGWFVAGNLYNAHRQRNTRPGAGTAPHTHTYRTAASKGLEAGPSYNGDVENLRDDNGAIPMDHRPAPAAQEASAVANPAQARTLRTPERLEHPTGDRVPAPSAATPLPAAGGESSAQPVGAEHPQRHAGSQAGGSTAAGAVGKGSSQETGQAQTRPNTQGTRARSTMPTGQYGTVRVNRNGTTNNVLTGEVVDTVPPTAKLTRAWDLSESTLARARPRQVATHTATYQMQKSRANHAAERGENR